MTDQQFLRMYNALKTISTHFCTPEQLKKQAEKKYGIEYEEALEMAYENIQAEAKAAIKGIRKPKLNNPFTD